MRRFITMLGLGIGVTVLSVSTAFAGCQKPRQSFPSSEGWEAVDQTFAISAGSACDVEVSGHVVGHERSTIDGKPATRDPQPGDTVVTESPDEVVTLTNTKSGKSVTKKINGAFYDHYLRNGTDYKGRGVGKNLYYGPGIYGLLWTNGVQKYTVYDYASDDYRIQIRALKGKSVELCHRLGANPVAGA